MKRNSRSSLENEDFTQQTLREKMINSLELPKDLFLGAAILTVTGNREVLIANYKESWSMRIPLFGFRQKLAGLSYPVRILQLIITRMRK